jgi:hypothetical protein
MSNIQEVWDAFRLKDSKFICKKCNKELIIDSTGSGEYTHEQRAFLILLQHLKKDHTLP